MTNYDAAVEDLEVQRWRERVRLLAPVCGDARPPEGGQTLDEEESLRVALMKAADTFGDLVQAMRNLNRPGLAGVCELAEASCRMALAPTVLGVESLKTRENDND